MSGVSRSQLKFAAVVIVPALAFADTGAEHRDTIADTLLALACVLPAARVGAHVAVRLGQAGVLGELLAGVLLGNLHPLGVADLAWVAADPTIDALSSLGVILLLSVGLIFANIGLGLSIGGDRPPHVFGGRGDGHRHHHDHPAAAQVAPQPRRPR